MRIECAAVELPKWPKHSNRLHFLGILGFVDVPSDMPPGGGRGHKVLLTRSAAVEALGSIVGMGINRSLDNGHHEAQWKIGIIALAMSSAQPTHLPSTDEPARDLPGGKVECEEEPQETIAREIHDKLLLAKWVNCGQTERNLWRTTVRDALAKHQAALLIHSLTAAPETPKSRIRTSFVNPPIPIRSFDWVAWIDGDEENGFHGNGKTEQEALDELTNLQAQFDEENRDGLRARQEEASNG